MGRFLFGPPYPWPQDLKTGHGGKYEAHATILIVLAALFFLVLMGVAGRRFGRSLRRTAGFALALLGIGVVFDPPSRHGLESVDSERDKVPSPGGGPDDT